MDTDQRLDLIFAALHSGKLAHEIDAELERHERRKTEKDQKKEKRRRNHSSIPPDVMHVAGVLEQLPGVRYVRHQPHSPETSGAFFHVGVEMGKQMAHITADIRADRNAMEGVRRKVMKQIGVVAADVNTHLANSGIILLHARLPENRIMSLAQQQLARIQNVRRQVQFA